MELPGLVGLCSSGRPQRRMIPEPVADQARDAIIRCAFAACLSVVQFGMTLSFIAREKCIAFARARQTCRREEMGGDVPARAHSHIASVLTSPGSIRMIATGCSVRARREPPARTLRVREVPRRSM